MPKTLLFGVLTVFLFLFFYNMIPVNWYGQLLYLIAIAGSVSIIVCVFLFFKNLLTVIPAHYISTTEQEKDSMGCFFGALGIGCFFALSFLFIHNDGRLREIEFRDHGVVTMSWVVDGSSFSTRKIDLTSLKVKFKMENGKIWTGEESISKNEFSNFYIGQRLPIIYSRRYPTVIKFLRSEEEYIKYLRKDKDSTGL